MGARKPIWNMAAKPSKRMRVQTFHDEWRHKDRIMRFTGMCVVCNKPTWAFDDGENDPRGPLGNNALWVTMMDDENGHEIRTCAICANDYDLAHRAQEIAARLGWVAVAPQRFYLA